MKAGCEMFWKEICCLIGLIVVVCFVIGIGGIMVVLGGSQASNEMEKRAMEAAALNKYYKTGEW